MAEIKIERKKKPIWPWLLLLLIVALLVWAIVELLNDDNEVTVEEAAVPGVVIPADAAHQEFYYA